jgi:septum formation protein
MMSNTVIYLASQSPRRKRLLKKVGIKFQSLKPDVSEKIIDMNPQRLAMTLAQDKVMSVEQKVKRGIIIGVDTVVVIDNKILGKPINRKDARKILYYLNNKEHRVISGVFILIKPNGYSIKTSETTRVKFRKLSKQEIEKYLDSKEPYDKAGAYGIQGKAGYFVEKVEGCYYNVVGLPLAKLLKLMEIIRNK